MVDFPVPPSPTYKGAYQRAVNTRFAYGRVNDYRLRGQFVSLPNQVEAASVAPASGEATLGVTGTVPAADNTDPVPVAGSSRPSWPAEAGIGGVTNYPVQGGVAVSADTPFDVAGSRYAGLANESFARTDNPSAATPAAAGEWAWGDGDTDTTNPILNNTQAHDYDAAGTYQPTVAISDNLGRTNTARTNQVVVTSGTAPVVSAFTFVEDYGTSADFSFSSTEGGTYYIGAYTQGSPTPSAAQVVAGGGTGYVSDNSGVAAAGANTGFVDGLTASTNYDYYLVVVDAGTNASNVAAVLNTSSGTLITVTIDSAATGGDGEIDLEISHDKAAGTIYYVVVPDGDPAPSVAQVIAGTDSSDAPALFANSSATTPFVDTATGLAFGTIFDIYAAAVDPNSGQTAAVVTDSATSGGTAAPVISGFSLTPYGTAFEGSVDSDSAGTWYVGAYTAGSPAPSAADVIAGAGTGFISVESAVAISGSNVVFVDGLTDATNYDVYAVVDGAGGSSNVLSIIGTNSDAAIVASINSAGSGSGAGEIDFDITADKSGTVYYVLVANGDPAPTVAEVIAGTASGGGVPESAGNDTTFPYTGTITVSDPLITYDLYVAADSAVQSLPSDDPPASELNIIPGP